MAKRHVFYIVPVLIAAAVIALSGVLYVLLRSDQDNSMRDAVALSLDAIIIEAELELASRAKILRRMAQRWISHEDGTPQAEWESDARSYALDEPGVLVIKHADSDHILQAVVPLEGHRDWIGKPLSEGALQQVIRSVAADHRGLTISAPAMLRSGDRGLFVLAPLYREAVYQGALIEVIRLDDWLSSVLMHHVSEQNFMLAVSFEGDDLLRIGGGQAMAQELTVSRTLSAGEYEWTVTLTPTQAYMQRNRSMVPQAISGAGVMIAVLIGALILALQIVRDRRKRSEDLNRSLSMSEQRLKAILDHTADAILTADAQGVIVSVNDFAGAMFGYEKDELIGQPISILLPEELRERHEWHVRNAIAPTASDAPVMARDVNARRRDGSALLLQITVSRVVIDREIVFVGIMRDMTARWSAEKVLHQQAEGFRLAADAMSAGLWNWSVETGAMTWSQRASEIMGLDPEGSQDRAVFFSRIHPDDQPAVEDAMESHLTSGAAFDLMYRICLGSGEIGWIHAIGQAVWDEDGRPSRMAGALLDVSEGQADREAIERHLTMLRLAESVAGIGSWTFDPDTREISWSDEMYRIFGVTSEDFALEWDEIFDLFHPLDRGRAESELREALYAGEAFQTEARITRPDGQVRNLLIQNANRLASQGVPGVVVGVVRDVTEMRRRELELSSFVDASSDGYWDWYIQDDYEYMSPRFWEILGYKPEEKRHHPSEWQKLIFPEDLKVVLSNFDKHVATQGEHPFNQEARYRHKDGSVKTLICRGSVIEWDHNNQPIRMVGTHVDITAIRDAEGALRKSEERFALAAKGACVGIWDWPDIHSQEQYWSETLYDLLGYTKEELPPTIDNFESILHPEDAAHVFGDLEEHFEKRTPYRCDLRLKHKEHGYLWYHCSGHARWDEHGMAERVIGALMDIHEAKTLNQVLQERTEALTSATTEVERLQTIIAGDLDLPLAEVASVARKLADVAQSGPVRDQAWETLTQTIHDLRGRMGASDTAPPAGMPVVPRVQKDAESDPDMDRTATV